MTRPARWLCAALSVASCSLFFTAPAREARAAPNPTATPRAPSPPARPMVPEGELPFVHIGTDLGIGELGAWQVAQDSKGYLWIGAESGVYRYDGRHAVRSEGLPAPYVTQIAVGRGDVVWVVSSAGVARLGDHGWEASPSAFPDLGLDAPRHIAVDDRGRLWATTPRGVVRERDDGALALDDDSASTPSQLGEPDGIAFDTGNRSGAVLIGGRGVIEVRAADGTRAMLREGLPAERVTGVARDARGRTWAVAASGVYVLEARQPRFERWADFPPSDTVVALDLQRRPWFASDAGLFYADDASAKHRVLGLVNDYLGGVFFDREGSLWALGFGIFRVAGRGSWHAHYDHEGLPSNTIWSVSTVGDELWVGTALGVARGTPNGWQPITAIPREPIRSIAPTANDGVWLSGANGSVARYDRTRDAVEVFGADRGVPAARTLAAAVDRDGVVWVGTSELGVARSIGSGAERRFARVDLPGAGERTTARDIVGDARGRLWIATDQGLYLREDSARGGDRADAARFRRYTVADGLAANATAYLLARRSGELCVAYWLTFGVECFRVDGETLSKTRRFDEQNGLSSNVVYLLGEDAAGRLWVGTNRGVDLWDGARMEHFGTLDGVPSFDTDARAFAATEGGDVFIGTSRGLGQFHGASYQGPPPPPTLGLEATHERGESASAALADGARIAFGDGAIVIAYSALSYLHEARMEYETRTLGVSDAWRPSSSDHTRYDALSPGSYEFQVRARHPGGVFSAPASMRFVVTPPWWQSAWFRASAAVVVLAAIVLAVRARSAALRRRNRELEAVVLARTRELATAHAEVARAEKLSALGRMLAQLSHELNNPINVVRNNVGPLREYVATMTRELATLREASHALPDGGRVAEERWQKAELDFVVDDSAAALDTLERAAERVSAIQGDLSTFLRGGDADKAPCDLNAIAKSAVALFQSGRGANVRFEARYGELPPVSCDAARIDQVLVNLLQNAVHAAGKGGTVTVRTWASHGTAFVAIEDDGPGVPAAIRDRIFEPFFTTKPVGKGTGLGLAVCRQIVVEQHGGALTLEDAEPRGASFRVALPVGEA